MESDWRAGLAPDDVHLLLELQELKNQENTLAVTICDFVKSSERLRVVWDWDRSQQVKFIINIINALKKYNWEYYP